MLIGVPKEIKSQEYRVGLIPASVRALLDHPDLRAGLNVYRGLLTCKGVAEALDYPCHDALQLLTD